VNDIEGEYTMKLLLTNNIQKECERLFAEYSEYYIATAWATIGFPLFDKLVENSSRIKKCIVGIHFYQTHPEFIATFIENKHVKFLRNPEGVFHPKTFLFKNKAKGWECIIGSANLTRGGFQSNDEMAVLINSKDAPAGFLYDFEKELERYWKLATDYSQKDLEEYRLIWEKNRHKIAELTTKLRKNGKNKIVLDLSTLNWDEYFRKVTIDDIFDSTKDRLLLLSETRKWFEATKHLKDMSTSKRTAIAGFYSKPIDGIMPGINWGWFGSMKGSGNFKRTVKRNNPFLSSALDAIPLDGKITRNDFENFRKEFMKSFEYKNPIAVATRLLCIKRPDYFVGINKANQSAICGAFDSKKTLNLNEYWDKIILKIFDSKWWNAPIPKGKDELEVYKARAAFLDVIYYKPIEKLKK
jgi:hypothetical protein